MFPASTYSSDLQSNLQNVEFYDVQTGTVIPSWLEGEEGNENAAQNLYLSSSIIYWVVLPESIPAGGGNADFAIGIGSLSTNFLNGVTVGAAPQLYCASGCPETSYAQYDNGAKIFKFYDNFKGSTLNYNVWSESTTSQNPLPSVDDGITFYESSNNALSYIIPSYRSGSPETAPLALDVLESSVSSQNPRMQIEVSSNPNTYWPASDSAWFANGYGASWEPTQSNPFEIVSVGSSSFAQSSSSSPKAYAASPMTIEWLYNDQDSGDAYAYYQGSKLTPPNYNACTSGCSFGDIYFSIMQGPSGASVSNGQFTVQWVRTRTPPVGGDDYMPTTSFGTLQGPPPPPEAPKLIITPYPPPPLPLPYLSSSYVTISATCAYSDACEISGPTGSWYSKPNSNTVNTVVDVDALPAPGIYIYKAIDQANPTEITSGSFTVVPGLTISPTTAIWGSGTTVTIVALCENAPPCELQGEPFGVYAPGYGDISQSINVNNLPSAGVWPYVATDIAPKPNTANGLSYSLSLSVLPTITFSENPAAWGDIVTVTATCGGI